MQINMNDNVMLVSQTSPLGVDFFHYWNGFFHSNKYAKMLARWVKTPYTEIHWFQSTIHVPFFIHGHTRTSIVVYPLLLTIISDFGIWNTTPVFQDKRRQQSKKKWRTNITYLRLRSLVCPMNPVAVLHKTIEKILGVNSLSRIPVNKGTNSRLGWTKYSDLYEIFHPSPVLISLCLLTPA